MFEKEHFLEGQDPQKTAIVPAVESMLEIRSDLSGRSGFDLSSLDDDILEEILQEWVRIIEPKCREYARSIALQSLGACWAEKFPREEASDDLIAIVDRILPASK